MKLIIKDEEPGLTCFFSKGIGKQEFGSETIDKQHCTQYGFLHSTIAGTSLANKQIIKIMNSLYYIGERTNPIVVIMTYLNYLNGLTAFVNNY